MVDGTDRTAAQDSESGDRASEQSAVGGVGTYEADGEVVFYDTENPLAWVESTASVHLREMV